MDRLAGVGTFTLAGRDRLAWPDAGGPTKRTGG